MNEYFENKPIEGLKKSISPNWDSTENHLKLLNIPLDAKKIVEYGCGMGRLLKGLCVEDRFCVGFDASKDMIKHGEEYVKGFNIELIKCSGEGEMNFKDEFFDYGFSIITFQHIPNTESVKKVISEFHRLLKKEGIIKFQILRENEFPERELWTWHNPNELISYMEELGFKKIKTEGEGRWLFISAIK